MIQLYILGPAFGLPSIDAECNAAVALAKQRLGKGEWTLIPTHDQTVRPPHLEDNDQHISGFDNIVRHLRDRGYLSQTPPLTSQQRADSVAASTFLSTHAQTLLDIAFYVSSENYSHTRSAFTRILPWHANYTLPPARRKAARQRTQHLGISSIDVDDAHDDVSNKPAGLGDNVGKEQKEFEPETQKRASLLLGGRQTVRSLLRRPEHSAVFKLHALADNFFEPLGEMLGERTWLLGTEEVTEVDCLAWGYLGVMGVEGLPQDWLKRTLEKKYGKLLEYLNRLRSEFEVETRVEDVMALSTCKSDEEVLRQREARGITLPWEPPATSSVADVAQTITNDLLTRLPLLYTPTTIIPSSSPQSAPWKRYTPLALTFTAASLGLSLYYVFSTGLLVWPHGEEVHVFGKKRLSDYGHLGAALAGVSLLGKQAAGEKAWEGEREGVAGVKVEVEGLEVGRGEP